MDRAIRLAGRITDWNDEKGFGFVVPNGGGTRAFVHINGAFWATVVLNLVACAWLVGSGLAADLTGSLGG